MAGVALQRLQIILLHYSILKIGLALRMDFVQVNLRWGCVRAYGHTPAQYFFEETGNLGC
jgi:hypothetical protein